MIAAFSKTAYEYNVLDNEKKKHIILTVRPSGTTGASRATEKPKNFDVFINGIDTAICSVHYSLGNIFSRTLVSDL